MSPSFRNILVASLLFPLFGFTQWVKEDDTSKVWMRDGVYLSQTDFLYNSPKYTWLKLDNTEWRFKDSLKRKRIMVEVSTQPHLKQDLTIHSRFLYVLGDSGEQLVDIRDIWGICVNGDPYRYLERAQDENFKRIPVLGTISFMHYTVRYEDPFYWTADVMRMEPEYRNETIDLVVDFQKPDIYANTRSNLEAVIRRDSSLYEQYANERKKYRAIYEYVKFYNEKYPLEFLSIPDSIASLNKK